MCDLRSQRRRSSPRRPPGPQAAGFGGEVRGAQWAARPGKRPVRADFTRQECAPPPPPPQGGRPRVSSAPRPRNARGSAADTHNTVGAAGPAPTPRSVRTPGTAAPVSRPQSEARAAPRIPIRRGAARPPRLRRPPYLSSSGRRRRWAASEQAHPAEAESGGRTENGPSAPPRNLLS